MLEMFIIFVD